MLPSRVLVAERRGRPLAELSELVGTGDRTFVDRISDGHETAPALAETGGTVPGSTVTAALAAGWSPSACEGVVERVRTSQALGAAEVTIVRASRRACGR